MHDRKGWIEHRLEELAEIFSVAVAGFPILDNHLHLLVRLDPDVAQGWSDSRRILAGQLPAPGGIHRAVVPRGQSRDLRRAGRGLRAAGEQLRELAGPVAEAGCGPVAGPFLRRQPSPVAGSRRAPGRAPPGEPGRLRGAMTPPRRLDSKLVSISLFRRHSQDSGDLVVNYVCRDRADHLWQFGMSPLCRFAAPGMMKIERPFGSSW